MDKRAASSDNMSSSPKKARLDPGELYKRPPVPKVDPQKDSFTFQQIEVDHYTGTVLRGMPGAQTGPVPVFRMYGTTMEGHSVLCHVHGFSPYFFVTLPDEFENSHCATLKDALNKTMLSEMRGNAEKVEECVLEVSIVERQSLQWYTGDSLQKFALIRVVLPRLVSLGARMMETNAHSFFNIFNYTYKAFESNIDFDIRFMVDTGIQGCCWIELPAGKYRLRPSVESPGLVKTSRCSHELDVAWDAFVAHSPEGEWAKVAPYYFLSFDIECAGRKGIFPEPDIDPVIQIANIVQRYGESEPIHCSVFTLNTCAPIAYAEVRSFQREADLLNAWADFVRELDPDILTGYNINNFDLPYLVNRANKLKLDRFKYLGRLIDVPSVVRDKVSQSKLLGKRVNKHVNIEGRTAYDMLIVARRILKLRSYTLNNVSQEVLKEQKEDVHYSQITGLQNGDEQTRHRLAIYCIKDAMLPLRLLNHLSSFTNDMELARVSGVTITTLLTRGEQIKVVTQLLKQGTAEIRC